MSHHRETNPHFNPQNQDHHFRPQSHDHGVPPPTPTNRPQVPQSTRVTWVPTGQEGPSAPSHHPHVSPPTHGQLPPPHSQQGPRPSHHPQVTPPSHSQQGPRPSHRPQVTPPSHSQQGPASLRVGRRDRDKALKWSLAAFCAIFWIIVIVGGLIVLIIYLVYRPQSPRFNISSVTLNAAYLDMGYLLNADVTVLANFTNPNKKVRVDYSYIIIDLYYGDTPIATTSIEPFSAASGISMFASLHMVTSQVRLSVKDRQRLAAQIQSNRVAFKINGLFRTRSKFGGLLKYSYWLYSHCSFVVTGPPSGVLVASKCRTKR